MEAVQLNSRIDAGLKQAGDATLQAMGYNPSKAIRALYRYLAANRESPDAALATLHAMEEAGRPEGKAAAAFARSRELQGRIADVLACAQGPSALQDLSYEELREEAALQRLQQRGLL